LRLLNPDITQIVPVADQTTEPELTSADTRPGWYTEEIPKLKAAERLSLDFSLHTPFLVPRVIIHSEVPDRFTCISTSFHEVYRKAKDLSQRLEWYSLENIRTEFGKGNLWPDIALTAGITGEELRVAADYINVARPDIIVDVMESPDWYETAGLESVKRHKKILNPRFGAFVVCLHPVPGAAMDEVHPPEQSEIAAYLSVEGMSQSPTFGASAPVVAGEPCNDIYLLNVNFEANALVPILDMLRTQGDKKI